MKQKVINTIIEVEVLRIKSSFNYDGNRDVQYRCEQARLFNIISDESGRGFIDELIRKEVMKLVQIYHSASPKLLHMITTEELILEYFFE